MQGTVTPRKQEIIKELDKIIKEPSKIDFILLIDDWDTLEKGKSKCVEHYFRKYDVFESEELKKIFKNIMCREPNRPTIKELNIESGNICNICRKYTEHSSASHIIPNSLKKKTSPRYNDKKENSYVRSKANHIVTCEKHTKDIDDRRYIKEYTTDKLLKLKEIFLRDFKRTTSVIMKYLLPHLKNNDYPETIRLVGLLLRNEAPLKSIHSNLEYIKFILDTDYGSERFIRDFYNMSFTEFEGFKDRYRRYVNKFTGELSKISKDIDTYNKIIGKVIISDELYQHLEDMIDGVKQELLELPQDKRVLTTEQRDQRTGLTKKLHTLQKDLDSHTTEFNKDEASNSKQPLVAKSEIINRWRALLRIFEEIPNDKKWTEIRDEKKSYNDRDRIYSDVINLYNINNSLGYVLDYCLHPEKYDEIRRRQALEKNS